MADMEILISVGLLVAVAAWVAGLCHRLSRLRAELRSAWEAWAQDTRRRNETLGEFAELYALLMPAGEMQPRTLRRLLADSDRALRAGKLQDAGEGELCRELERATSVVGETAVLRSHEGMAALCEQLTKAQKRQKLSEQQLQEAEEAYLAALKEPPVRLVAPSLGFH